jgi:hypothetical protein
MKLLPLLIILLYIPLVSAGVITDQAFLTYGDDTSTPKYRIWNDTLSIEINAQTTTDNVDWIELATHPFQQELIMVTMANSGTTDEVDVQIWNGTAWSTPTQIGTDSDVQWHGIDVVYESKSGDGIIVYSDNDASTPYARVWDGTTISSEITLPAVDSGNIRSLVAASNPSDDEVLLLTEDSNNDVNFYHWDGTSWSNPTEIETDSWGDYQPIAVTYERSGTEALVMYADNDDNTPYYRVWTSANDSLSQEYTAPSIGNDPRFYELASHPTTDEIVLIVEDDGSDTNIMVWDGASWGNQLEVATAGVANRKAIGTIYEQLTGNAHVVYNDNSQIPKTRVWDGASWGIEVSLESVGDEPFWFELAADPFSNNLILMTGDNGGDVTAFTYDGSTWTNQGEIDTNTWQDNRGGIDVEYTIINDSIAPIFSNEINTPPSPAWYVPENTYTYNITVTDDKNLDTIYVDFNNINYTSTSLNDVYTLTLNDLAAGTVSYSWYANDSLNNINSTSSTYSILQSPTQINLTLDTRSQNITINQSEIVIIEGFLTNTTGIINLTINGATEVSELNNFTYNKNFTSTSTFEVALFYFGNENYTASNNSYVITVNAINTIPTSPINTTVNLTLNDISADITINQDETINIEGYVTNATDIINLTINGATEVSELNNFTYNKKFTSVGIFEVALLYFGNITHLASNVTYNVTVNAPSSSSGGSSSGGGTTGGGGETSNLARGYNGRSEKYRTGTAPTTSQTSGPSAPSPTSSPSTTSAAVAQPSSSRPTPLTGAVVASQSSSGLNNILGAFIRPTEKEIGIILIMAMLAILINHIYFQIKQDQKKLVTLKYASSRGNHPPPQAQKQFVKVFKSSYSAENIPKQVHKVNSAYKQSSTPHRNINKFQFTTKKIQGKGKTEMIKTLKEVYK